MIKSRIWLILTAMTLSSACGITGLGPSTAPVEDDISLNLSDTELNDMIEPAVTRGTVSSYYISGYSPVTCNRSGSYSCSNIDLQTDSNSTNNTENYYLIQNKNGDCLATEDGSSYVRVSTCNAYSDNQRWRLSFYKNGTTSYNLNKLNIYYYYFYPAAYNGGTQTYPNETKAIKNKALLQKHIFASTSERKTKAEIVTADTTSSGDGFRFGLYKQKSNSYTYDGQTGDYFWLYNDALDACFKDNDSYFRPQDWECYNTDAWQWRVMKINETPVYVETNPNS